MADMTLLLTVKRRVRWYALTLSSLKKTLAQALNRSTVYGELAALPQQQQGQWFYNHLVYAHRWSGVKIKTYFSTFLELNFIATATLMSDPFVLSSFPIASILQIISSIDCLMLTTSLPLMRLLEV